MKSYFNFKKLFENNFSLDSKDLATEYRNEKSELHREDGPAYDSKKLKIWYINGKKHRINKPAMVWSNGRKEWYFEDKRHRIDGPAIEVKDKSYENEYWIDGIEYTENEFYNMY